MHAMGHDNIYDSSIHPRNTFSEAQYQPPDAGMNGAVRNRNRRRRRRRRRRRKELLIQQG